MLTKIFIKKTYPAEVNSPHSVLIPPGRCAGDVKGLALLAPPGGGAILLEFAGGGGNIPPPTLRGFALPDDSLPSFF